MIKFDLHYSAQLTPEAEEAFNKFLPPDASNEQANLLLDLLVQNPDNYDIIEIDVLNPEDTDDTFLVEECIRDLLMILPETLQKTIRKYAKDKWGIKK